MRDTMKRIILALSFALLASSACAQTSSLLNLPATSCAYAAFSPGSGTTPPSITCAAPPAAGATGATGAQGPIGLTGATGPAGASGTGSGCVWKAVSIASGHPVVAADNCTTMIYDGGVPGTVVFPTPATLGPNFSAAILVYSGSLTLTKNGTFNFKGGSPNLLALDNASVQPDDKGNWSLAVSNAASAAHP